MAETTWNGVTPPRPSHPPYKKAIVWISNSHKMALDAEILRRKSVGEGHDRFGTPLSRSVLIRELIEANYQIPDNLRLTAPDEGW